MPYAINNGVRIHYTVEGQGQPLVLQHGSAASLHSWFHYDFVKQLKQTYRLILVDARGHGESDKPHDESSYSLSLRVDDIQAVLDDLNISKTHFWGYSMGGWIGFGMALYAPKRVRSLVIGGAHPFEDTNEAFTGIDAKDPDAFIRALEHYVGADFPDEIKQWIALNDFKALSASMHPRQSLKESLGKMTMPFLMYAGSDDPRYIDIKACASLLPNANLDVFFGLDHVQACIRSDRILPRVLMFLKGAELES